MPSPTTRDAHWLITRIWPGATRYRPTRIRRRWRHRIHWWEVF